MFLYDGKTGDRVAEFGGEDSHKGTVFSLSWNPDSKQVLSASADMTAKVWDAATQKVLSTFKFADRPNPDHQQVGCLWQGEFLISLSLSGDINYLDPRSPAVPTRVVRVITC